MRTWLSGVEAITFEIDGALPLDAVRAIVPPGLAIEPTEGGAAVSVLLLRMRGLRPRWLPAPGLDYGEALWRIGVRFRAGPAWLGHLCDLDAPLVRVTGRWLIRYPVRAARFAWPRDGDRDADFARVDALGATLTVTADPGGDAPPPEPPRPLLVRSGPALFQVPWRETPAPHRRSARVAIDDRGLGRATFGSEIAWSGRGLVHRGRIHHCGFAHRAR
jgi:hypothetical protein